MEKKPQYKVIVSDRARQMLAGHVGFMAQKSPTAARRTKNELMDAISSLSTMPERFPFLNTDFIPLNKYHKMFVEKWYLILPSLPPHLSGFILTHQLGLLHDHLHSFSRLIRRIPVLHCIHHLIPHGIYCNINHERGYL